MGRTVDAPDRALHDTQLEASGAPTEHAQHSPHLPADSSERQMQRGLERAGMAAFQLLPRASSLQAA